MNDELLSEEVVIPQQEGLVNSFKEYLNPKNWAEKCNLSKQKMIECGIYFLVGFGLGFLIKKYSNFLYAAAVTIVGITLLHYLGFITIAVHTDRLQSVLGIEFSCVQSDMPSHCMEWVKMNIVLVVSLVVGFIIGLKVP